MTTNPSQPACNQRCHDTAALVLFYGATLIVQYVGAQITATSVSGWYQTLETSVLTPPGYVFGIVWTILYILMAVAAWRVWRIERSVHTQTQLIWLAQLVGGLIWTAVFFGMKQPQQGLAIIACLAILIASCHQRFARIDRLAGHLLKPLLLWVCFATYLNLTIVALN